MATKYRVVFTADSDGWWTVTVPDAPGAITQARSVEQGLNRIREAISLVADDADDAELVADVKLPAQQRRAIERAKKLQESAERAQAAAAKANREVVRKLRTRLSTRDVAHVVGISPARVGQLEHD